MVRNGRQQSVKAARRPELRLPDLAPWEGRELEPDGDYDGLEFADLDLAGQEGVGARFMDCAVRRCALDEAGLAKARILDSVLEGVRGVGTDLSGASLRDVDWWTRAWAGCSCTGPGWSGWWSAAARSTT